jgi:hypothetical protein
MLKTVNSKLSFGKFCVKTESPNASSTMRKAQDAIQPFEAQGLKLICTIQNPTDKKSIYRGAPEIESKAIEVLKEIPGVHVGLPPLPNDWNWIN